MCKLVNEEFRLCRIGSSGMFEPIVVFYSFDIAQQAGHIFSAFYKKDLFIVHYVEGVAVTHSCFPLRIEWF